MGNTVVLRFGRYSWVISVGSGRLRKHPKVAPGWMQGAGGSRFEARAWRLQPGDLRFGIEG